MEKRKNKLLKKLLNEKRGITLIALVITIIVLLILAGVTIATLTGDNGLLQKAQTAKEKSTEGEICEQLKLVYAEYQIGNYDSEVIIQKRLEDIFGKENVSGVSHNKEKRKTKSDNIWK